MAARAGKLTGGVAGKWRWRGGSRVAGAFASADRAAAAAGVDGWLMIIVVGLVGFGLVMVYSASEALGFLWFNDPNYFFAHQLIGAALGAAGLVVAARLDYHNLARLARPAMFLMLILLVVVLIPHVGSRHFGAQRWFQVGPLSVQPSAIAVGVAIVFFSRWLTDREGSVQSLRGVRDYVIVLAALLGLVLAERDFGSSIVIAATALILLALAGARKRHLLLIVVGFGASSFALVGLVAYRADRLAHFLNPCAAALGSGFQNCQALYAFGSGGIFGVGLGNSVQKYEWLPEAHTDFIFAIIGEELGLIGTVAVLGAFLFLAWRGVRASLRAPDRFGALLAGGITSWICMQAFINVMAVTGVIPTTGIPLPFISYGGTSLATTLVGMGILLNISAQGRRQGTTNRAHVDRWGGNWGHLTPALAVALALRSDRPDDEVAVVGRRDGVAERLVVAAGLHLETLEISGVDVGSAGGVARATTQLTRATIEARRLLRRMHPDVVVGAGGYVSVPVVVAALAQRIPVVLLEQNAVPGRATRMLARRARVVAASFAETSAHLPHAHVVHTGNPIRAEVRAIPARPAGDRLRSILVTGGSQGARRLNRAVAGCMVDLLRNDPELSITHQCGSLDYEAVARAAEALPPRLASRYSASAFFDDMAVRIARSDLVVMRAGGSSLAECSALGRPMIVVPYPHAGGHQRHNAAPYVAAGAAMLIDDAECTPARLGAEIGALVADPPRWRAMASASAALGLPDATDSVVRLIVDAAGPTRSQAA